ncbi:MAG: HypC/HybG/HupF family hydrogenase formation chaperone [Alphaproteobacteria bacterium]|nr:HypC/HybG/HupF family hydrogenase formation chaperone [Alphaproteobacteria bacterium]
MCLAVPAKIVSLGNDDKALVDLGGVQKEISVKLLDNVTEGDYVLVHAGFALSKMDETEAEETLELFVDLQL